MDFPARIRAVDTNGVMTPEFYRALQSLARSAVAPVGSMTMTGNASATTASGTPAKVAGTTTAGELYAFDHTTGRLTYTGTVAKALRVIVTASFTSTSGNKVGVGVSINGTASMQYATAGSGTDHITAQAVHEFSPGDYIEAIVSNASGNPVTVTDLAVTAR